MYFFHPAIEIRMQLNFVKVYVFECVIFAWDDVCVCVWKSGPSRPCEWEIIVHNSSRILFIVIIHAFFLDSDNFDSLHLVVAILGKCGPRLIFFQLPSENFYRFCVLSSVCCCCSRIWIIHSHFADNLATCIRFVCFQAQHNFPQNALDGTFDPFENLKCLFFINSCQTIQLCLWHRRANLGDVVSEASRSSTFIFHTWYVNYSCKWPSQCILYHDAPLNPESDGVGRLVGVLLRVAGLHAWTRISWGVLGGGVPFIYVNSSRPPSRPLVKLPNCFAENGIKRGRWALLNAR